MAYAFNLERTNITTFLYVDTSVCKEDGLIVMYIRECNEDNYNGKEDDYEEFGDVDWETAEEGKEGFAAPTISSTSATGEEDAEQKSFPEFSQKVVEEMKQLGGDVFLKLNWSSPKVPLVSQTLIFVPGCLVGGHEQLSQMFFSLTDLPAPQGEAPSFKPSPPPRVLTSWSTTSPCPLMTVQTREERGRRSSTAWS